VIINVYACGGAGINLGSQLVKFNNRKDPGFAELKTFFIDTSKSNIQSNIPEDNIYLVDGLDGSGKKRDTNYVALAECSKEILHQFKPADINIVLHSASGGSGSVIAPILVSELLSRKSLTIVILIGSTSSRIEAENTSKTLKSYEMISHKRNMPVIAAYKENSPSKP
jgi:cell division GTPase FtsZ